jgi:WD repeat-containing protein 24
VHIPHKPTYTLHPYFPVRRVRWRAEYECEVAVVSNDEFGEVSGSDFSDAGGRSGSRGAGMVLGKGRGDAVEIWDVRRGWIAKWAVGRSAGVAGECSIPYLLSPFTHLI